MPDDLKIGRLSIGRAQLAGEIGAAMAHELNGPITALLLYVGDIQQSSDRFIDANGDGGSLKRVVDGAVREAERICALIHRMGDFFEAPLPESTAIAVARDAIAWWSRAGQFHGKGRIDAGDRLADDSSRPGMRPLTPREREVLRFVSDGCSNKEGAMLMKISYRTFECHRAEVMRKMGAKNAVDLVRMAFLDPSGSGTLPEQRGA